MYRAKYLLAAQGAVIDRATGSLSVFNVLEALKAAAYPMFLQSLSIVFHVTREATDPQHATFRILGRMEGDEIFGRDMETDFAEKLGAKVIVMVQGFPISRAGNVVFELKHEGDLLADWIVQTAPADPQLFTVTA